MNQRYARDLLWLLVPFSIVLLWYYGTQDRRHIQNWVNQQKLGRVAIQRQYDDFGPFAKTKQRKIAKAAKIYLVTTTNKENYWVYCSWPLIVKKE